MDRKIITCEPLQVFDLSTMKLVDSMIKILSDTNNLLDRLLLKHQFYGYSFAAIYVYKRDYQLCKVMPPPGRCRNSGAAVHF